MVALHISADKFRIMDSGTKQTYCYTRIHVRPAFLEAGETRFFTASHSTKSNDFYAGLDLHGFVSSKMAIGDELDPSFLLSYDASFLNRLELSAIEKMGKTLRAIDKNFQQLSCRAKPDCFNRVLFLGTFLKAKSLIIDEQVSRFPEDFDRVKSFFLKIINSCYEMHQPPRQVLRFTNSASILDLPNTTRLSESAYPCPVLIKMSEVEQQASRYEKGHCFCWSEAEFRNAHSIAPEEILLDINQGKEEQIDKRLQAFYQKYQITNLSGWKTYNKTFFRNISITEESDGWKEQTPLTIFVEFQYYEQDSEILKVWTNRDSISID